MNTVSGTSSFYTRVSISAKGETKYYDYNPLFAQSVVSVSGSNAQSALPDQVNIRSPRHLYNLSRVYVKDSVYKDSIVYAQLRNIDYAAYNWNDFTLTSSVSMQKPIGSDSTVSFSAVYDGGTNTIGNISFASDGDYIGMFGYVEGTVRNVVLTTQYTEGQPSYYVQRNKTIDKNETVYAGILAGYNAGTIQNSAVAGYYLSGTANTIKGYANSKVYLGGFVGYNAEKGVISNCSADSPKMSVDMFQAECYAGGFTGCNEGSITNAYALTHITSSANSGKTIIAGFTAHNTGSISDTYCAAALTSSGVGSVSYAYSPIGGSIKNSRYLTKGTYYLGYEVNSYDRNEANSAGTPSSYADLQKGSKATSSFYHAKTTELDDAQSNYPFTAYVKKADGSYVHYGEWHVKPSLGKMGVFYWEKETSGNNNGYKISYIGIDVALQQVEQESTLCTAHDDGGVIEEYGYGYYTSEDLENVTVNYDSLKVGGAVNEEAQRSLQQQLSGFHFYPYTTKTAGDDYICLEGTGTNGQITLTQTDTQGTAYSYTFTISPFFGNALSLNDAKGAKVSEKASAYTGKTVGWSALPYQIRSAQQLQYINWSYTKDSEGKVIVSCTDQVDGSNYQNFNYLMHTTIPGTGKQTKDSAGRKENANIVFKQSHDLNAETISDFQPVAGQNTSSSATSYDATLYAWFGGTYDGQSYKIQELKITSDSFTVGLFGVTVDADICNTILYSTKGAVIQRLDTNKNHVGGYSIGGLVGVAYDYTREENSSYVARAIRNCSIAGYTIIDNSANDMGLGEANVGGLTGVANINIDQCSSTANIMINSTSYPAEWGAFIRVGGITGGLKDTITNCYSGGKITVGQETLDATYTGHGQPYDVWTRDSHVSVNDNLQATVRVSTHVYIAGVAGSGFTMNYKNFSNKTGTDDGRPNVENCYTYMEFPALEGTIRSISTIASVADRYALATLKGITNCTYLDSSADIDVSKAPKYYFAGTKNNTMYNLANNTTQMKDMLLGNSTYVAKYFGSSAKGSVVNEEKNTSKTYAQMSSNSFLNKMNGGMPTGTSKFHAVTSTEKTSSGEQPINGKYSFNAGDSTLDGRNYPFPTVITQPTKENTTVNVHYGTWPNHDPYWSNGMDTLDIFSELNTAGEAVKTFTLNTNGKTFDLKSENITFDTAGIVAVQGVMKVNDAYQVTLKALKTGTVTVTAHMKIEGQDVESHFTLSVTANLTVTANPSELVLSNEGKQQVNVSMYPTADTTKVIDAKNITWNVTSSHDILEPDVGVSEVSGNIVTITGFGVNGKVSVKGTVTYNGIPYSASTMIVVDRPAAVGLSDSSSYCEAGIVNDSTVDVTGTLVTDYDDRIKPENTSSRYFIYAANDNDILGGNIDIKVTSTSGEPNLDAYVDKNDVTTSSNGFTSIPVYITYRNSNLNTALTDVHVEAVITKDGKKYTLTLENVTVKPTPYTVRLHGNGGIFTNLENVDDSNKQDEIKTVPVMNDITLTNGMYNLKRTGYTFEGWYTDVTVSETKKDSVTFAETQADMDLYALWKPKTAKIKMTVGDKVSYVDITYDLSYLTLDSKPGDGMYCTGWYQDGKKILDGDGHVIDQVTWNKAILNASSNEDVVYTLTPEYAPYKQITLNLNGGTYGGSYDTFTVYAKDGVIDLSEYTPVKNRYTFIGWYTNLSDETTKVDEVDTSTQNGIELHAKYTIGIIDFKVKKTDGSEETAGKTVYFTEVPETVNVEGFPEQYKKLDNNYLFEGWYIDIVEDNTVNSIKVLDTEGKVVNTNIFTVANPKTYALYAKWVRVTTTLATSFEDNSSYIFTNENIQEAANNGDSYGMTSTKKTESTLSGNNLKGSVSKVDNTSCVFTSLEALQSVEWAYTGGTLINQSKYLTAQRTWSILDGYMYSLQVSESPEGNFWHFTNSGGPIRIYSNNCYLEDSDNNFYATDNSGSVWAYKLNKEYKDTVE
ncbi:MAG: InlB B-repeat-containing protein [Bulleidia sp.]|nr:InlB B-repeat-containing protein [Bulleidia sp.]